MTDHLYDYIAELPFSKRLAIVMALADITSKELAYEAGLSLSAVYGYRSGCENATAERRQQFDEIVSSRAPLLKGLLKEG